MNEPTSAFAWDFTFCFFWGVISAFGVRFPMLLLLFLFFDAGHEVEAFYRYQSHIATIRVSDPPLP
jgi:hypothetical protein